MDPDFSSVSQPSTGALNSYSQSQNCRSSWCCLWVQCGLPLEFGRDPQQKQETPSMLACSRFYMYKQSSPPFARLYQICHSSPQASCSLFHWLSQLSGSSLVWSDISHTECPSQSDWVQLTMSLLVPLLNLDIKIKSTCFIHNKNTRSMKSQINHGL